MLFSRRPSVFSGLACAFFLSIQCDSAPLTWQAIDSARYAELARPATGSVGFKLLEPALTGVAFTNRLSEERYLTNQIYLNGSGVAAGDVDGDGWTDLYFCGLENPNALFRNLGNWKFEEVTANSGLAAQNLDATGAALCDLDGDRDLDLVLNSVAQGTWIYLNDGKGHFVHASTVNQNKAGMSLALADIDGDGDLDLYVANYRVSTIRDEPNTRLRVQETNGQINVISVNGRPATEPDLVGRFTLSPSGKIKENGEADALFLNDGKAGFTPVSWTSGAFLDADGRPLKTPPYDWGLSVMFRDINADGAPDLYVCNDFESDDRIWINNGKGQFRALPPLALRSTSMFSMGVDFADIDRDGYDDFFVADMLSPHHLSRHLLMGEVPPMFPQIGKLDDRPQYSRNTLFWNRGDGGFAEIGQFSGVEASDWSWTPLFLDVDLDGYEDLLITTGHELEMMNADVIQRAEVMKSQRQMSVRELLELRKMFSRLALPKVAFRNKGNLKFEMVTSEWGFNQIGVSHGMAAADLDHDGDLDLIVNNLNGVAGVYRNEASAPRIAVRLKGNPPNTHGIGARISLRGGAFTQSQEIICGGRYLSSDDPVRTFAAGSGTNFTLEVNWRNGRQTVIHPVQPNRLYEIAEGNSQPKSKSAPTAPPRTFNVPLFEDLTRALNHVHAEETFDDFAQQPLLPKKLSQPGPGVSWFDVNGDHWDDLIIASGRGGQLALFLNNGSGGFNPKREFPLTQPVTRDQTSVLGWSKNGGKSILLAGSSNYEDGIASGPAVRQYDLTALAIDDKLPGQSSSTGPLAMADYDADGALDLFVGGRVVPNRYPEPASSFLMRGKAGEWERDSENSARLDKVGLVNGATWSDLNGDGFPELILACEWGPIRVFRNDKGQLTDATETLGLARFKGWWNGVATGDFDGDGRLDIVASNFGLNSRYHATPENPRKVYFGDIDGNGTFDLIEAMLDRDSGRIVPDRGYRVAAMALPYLSEKFPTFESFAKASVADLLGEAMKSTPLLEATTLASMLWLNRGDRFEPRELPWPAQLAPAFGISVADIDGDGAEDLFLAQNFFAVAGDQARCDAGVGLWLRGNGQGGFEALEPKHTRVRVFGEQRGCAISDFDADGRVDLVVTQNGAATRLFRNVGARPGLRVRLTGNAGNPNGVGAIMRLKHGEQFGPARELRAGSGYCSQDSAVQVLALSPAHAPMEIHVQWPGGTKTSAAIPPAAKEIQVDIKGEVQVVK